MSRPKSCAGVLDTSKTSEADKKADERLGWPNSLFFKHSQKQVSGVAEGGGRESFLSASMSQSLNSFLCLELSVRLLGLRAPG